MTKCTCSLCAQCEREIKTKFADLAEFLRARDDEIVVEIRKMRADDASEVARLRAKLAGGCAMCDTLRETNRILDAVNRALRAKLAKVREACEPDDEYQSAWRACDAAARNKLRAEIAAALDAEAAKEAAP